MFIEIEDLAEEPLHFQHRYPLGELKLAHEDAVLSELVSVDFVLTHPENELYLDGAIHTAVRYRCSRCLEEFSRNLDAEFDLEYLPQPKVAREGDEIELKYEDMEIGFYDGVRFDVNLMVLEQVELALPMQFVCREDCKGLCDRCGANRNEGACNCPDTTPDSRFGALLDFKKKTQS